jgi:L-lactate dehydrogenase complex protein LldG
MPPDDRDLIFRRIREALQVRREHVAPYRDAAAYRAVLPVVGGSFDERVARFREWSERLNTEVVVCSRADFPKTMAALAATHAWKRAACHGAELARQALAAAGLDNAAALHIDDSGAKPYDKDALEACDLGISACDALVAQTGSILLSSRSAGGRALSVLPPHHLAVATADQLLPDLPAAMALIRERYGRAMPSLVSLHTGPSRTGDIERTIVLGAHGPKKLTVVLIAP